MDMILFCLIEDRIQSNKDIGCTYFFITICTHRPDPLITFHTLFVASALANIARLFNPQPPINFGQAKVFHEVHGNPDESLLPYQRNLKHIFLIFSKIPTGIQKTRIASSTTLTSINLPPLEIQRKLQFLILFSTLEINQSQSLSIYLQHLR